MDAKQLQTVTALQRRADEIDRAIKDTQNFVDQKAFLMGEDGKKVVMSRAELFDLRAKVEAEIVKAA